MSDFLAQVMARFPHLHGSTASTPSPTRSQNKQDEPRDGFMRLVDAAEFAGVSERTLRNWQSRGLPIYRPTKRTALVRRRELVEFITTGKVTTANEAGRSTRVPDAA